MNDFNSYVNSNSNKGGKGEQKGGMDYASVISALAGKYEGRIYSRIVGSDYTVLFFSGKDHRIG